MPFLEEQPAKKSCDKTRTARNLKALTSIAFGFLETAKSTQTLVLYPFRLDDAK